MNVTRRYILERRLDKEEMFQLADAFKKPILELGPSKRIGSWLYDLPERIPNDKTKNLILKLGLRYFYN